MQRFLSIIILFPILLQAQSFKRTLQNANSINFKNSVVAYGLEQNKTEVHFKLYRISNDWKKTDSLSVSLGKEKTENYLEITADTLHGFLNFYFQKLDSKNTATLVRLDDSLKIVTKADNFDAVKINSLTSFEDEKFFFQNAVYLVRTSEDSLGKQFYLNKFEVSDHTKPFEYKQNWQFAFEKRHIKTAHVFYADTNIAMIYVNVQSGPKTGQWILRLNSNTGELIKGSKLNPKGDQRLFLFSNFHFDLKSKQLLAIGNIYTPQQLSFENKTFNFTGLTKQNRFFFVRIDSLGEVISRDEQDFPITVPTVAGSKAVFFYHVKIKEVKKKSDSDFKMYCNLYKTNGQQMTFLYETGFSYAFSIGDMGIEIDPDKLYICTSSLPKYIAADPKDIWGKYDLNSISEFDRFLYAAPLADVERFFGKDDLNNPKWLLMKTSYTTGIKTFTNVKVGAKGLEHKILLENDKFNHPNLYKINNDKLILFNTDPANTSFEVSQLNW